MSLAALLDDARLALTFLTRVKVRLREEPQPGALARAMRLFPLVGGAIGLAVGGVYALAHLALPPWPSSLLALAAGMALTGALHEDGLADCADGFGGGEDPESKLRIMRDSVIGSYGTLALILSVSLRASALAGLHDSLKVLAASIAAHALARAVLPIAMAILPAASSSGVAAGAGRCGGAEASQAALLALAVTALALPSASGSLAILAAGGAASLFGLLARRQIGGYSGDVLGAMEQLAEIAALLAILAAQGGKA